MMMIITVILIIYLLMNLKYMKYFVEMMHLPKEEIQNNYDKQEQKQQLEQQLLLLLLLLQGYGTSLTINTNHQRPVTY